MVPGRARQQQDQGCGHQQVGEGGAEEEAEPVGPAPDRRQRRVRHGRAARGAGQAPHEHQGQQEEAHARAGEPPHPQEQRVPAGLDARLRLGLERRVVHPRGDAARERVGEPVARQLAADLLRHQGGVLRRRRVEIGGVEPAPVLRGRGVRALQGLDDGGGALELAVLRQQHHEIEIGARGALLLVELVEARDGVLERLRLRAGELVEPLLPPG